MGDLFRDNVQSMAQSLQNIETLLKMQEGLIERDNSVDNVYKGQGPAAQSGVLDPASYVVRETDDLDKVDSGGTITLSPGDTETIVDARANSENGIAVMAVGATDEPGVTYRLRVDDDRVVGGDTNSPLGLLNTPFSFIESYGAIIPAEKYVEYEATLDSSASSPVELAARLHVEGL